MADQIDRSTIPQAHSFTLTQCEDPMCGPHIIANDRHGRPIVEIVMSREQGMKTATGILSIISGKVGE
jgi:hypothetical protein